MWSALALMAACLHPSPERPPDTVIGIARDAKAGAVVVADDGRAIYVAGLDAWHPDLAGRRVKLTGRVVQERYVPEATVGPDGAWSQGTEPGGPPDTVIRDATWEVAAE